MAQDPNADDTGNYDPTEKLWDPDTVLKAYNNTKEEDRDVEKVTNKPYLFKDAKELESFVKVFDKDNVSGFILICLGKDYAGDDMVMKKCYDWKASDQAAFIFGLVRESSAADLYGKYGKDTYYAVLDRDLKRQSKAMAASKFGSIGKKLGPSCKKIAQMYE